VEETFRLDSEVINNTVPTDRHLCKTALRYLDEQGWAKVYWHRNYPLEELAELLILETDSSEMYQLGKYTRLRAVEKTEASAGSKSALRGLNSFPLHTDEAAQRTPPRYILMRSLSGISTSETHLLCFSSSHISDKLFTDLAGGLWVCRGTREPHISSVWENERIRWDEDCMRPVDRLAKRAHSKFRVFCARAEKISYRWSNHSSVLLIDNWKTMHGRASVSFNEQRQLERVYVEKV